MKFNRVGIISLMLLAATGFGLAGDDAEKWLEKVADVYKKAPLSSDYTAKMKMNQMGMEMVADMSGTMIYKDPSHQNMKLKMVMDMQGQKMEMDMTTISDGTTLWTEVTMPGGMGKQVTKMTLAKVNKMMDDMGMDSSMLTGGSINPSQMVESMRKFMDLTMGEVKDGKVTINAVYKKKEVDPSNPMAQAMTMMQGTTMKMILTEKSIFPIEMNMFMAEETEPMMKMVMDNIKFLKESDLPQNAFSYTPPEGVQVMDMDAMMDQQMKGASGGSHDGHKH